MPREHAQRRRADRAGRAEHRHAARRHRFTKRSTCGKVKRKYATGSANSMPSMRSSTPPCPGMRCELSFTSAFALEQRLHEIADLHRRADHGAEHERGAACADPRLATGTSTQCTYAQLASMQNASAPIAPSRVFPGLTDGISFGAPNARPTKYARGVGDPGEHERIERRARSRPARSRHSYGSEARRRTTESPPVYTTPRSVTAAAPSGCCSCERRKSASVKHGNARSSCRARSPAARTARVGSSARRSGAETASSVPVRASGVYPPCSAIENSSRAASADTIAEQAGEDDPANPHGSDDQRDRDDGDEDARRELGERHYAVTRPKRRSRC